MCISNFDKGLEVEWREYILSRLERSLEEVVYEFASVCNGSSSISWIA